MIDSRQAYPAFEHLNPKKKIGGELTFNFLANPKELKRSTKLAYAITLAWSGKTVREFSHDDG